MTIDQVFDQFDDYRKGFHYFEDGEWKEVHGIFSRPGGEYYWIEFDDKIETANVSRRIPTGTVVRLSTVPS